MRYKNRIRAFEDIDAVCVGFSSYIQTLMDNSEGSFNIALSGGSTPKALFNYWSAHHNLLDWNRLRFFWGDERCVPPDDEESNFGMTKKLLLDPLSIPDKQVFRIKGENNPEVEAKSYSQLLQSELSLQNEIPVFDLIILGMGDDGHTASIFPHQKALWYDANSCVVADHPTTGQKRISITGRIIKNAKQVAFLITGTNKAEMLQNIFYDPENASQTFPAAKVNLENPHTVWFLDQAAAKLIH
jgi:6-phosphogluconolactonase